MDNLNIPPDIVAAFWYLVALVIAWLAALVANTARRYFERQIKRVDSELVLLMAETAVRAAQQMYDEYDNEEKREAAMDILLADLSKNGINIDPVQAQNIMEAAYNAVKGEFVDYDRTHR